jgi:arylsulfatase A-like enzyme
VLLTADHGESLGEDGYWFMHTHATTPDVAHVPFIVRAAGLAPERREELVSHIDVLPTLLELAGLPVPAEARGVALGPVLRGEAQLPARLVYCDNGSQLSVYNDDGFVRIRGLEGAWRGSGVDLARKPRPFGRFVWHPGQDWKSVEQGHAPLPRELADYAGRAVPMVDLPPPGPERAAQLRALGYLD